MTQMDAAQIKIAVDAILTRARLQVTPDEYERLLSLYPIFQAQSTGLRLAELHDREPAVIYPARPAPGR